MNKQVRHTLVGVIPELLHIVETGFTFKAYNAADLKESIGMMLMTDDTDSMERRVVRLWKICLTQMFVLNG